MDIALTLSQEFNINLQYVANIISLVDEGNTLPFIARYRKEMTGGIDDQILRDLNDRLEYLRNLQKRKDEVQKSIGEQGKLTPELQTKLDKAVSMTEVEDIYRPFKPKRRTRATIAVEAGLQPLADIILAQELTKGAPEELAAPFVNADKGISTPEEAIKGACDIVAETMSDDADVRKKLRDLLLSTGELSVDVVKECENGTYDMYKKHVEFVCRIPAHRILAVNRGEKEGYLSVKISADNDAAVIVLTQRFLKKQSIFTTLIKTTVQDSLDRLILPSVEREVRNELFDRASEQAIKMFELNLKPLLLQPPIKGKVVMGLDPGYRTGCKVAVVDATGKVLDHTIVYPTHSESMIQKSKQVIIELIQKHSVNAISIGNGTASKETEAFAVDVIKDCGRSVGYMVVNEAGASVYSASKLAAEEFPEYDVTTRSAVSIARRLQDPLAELIKIDPKSIGVGQYQHDMPPARLDSALGGVVEDCVNSVGVDINTASAPLLAKVAGINSGSAKAIVEYREQNGKFFDRTQLLKVPKIGQKAYGQCAGFLRITDGKNVLDNTAVHPESYGTVNKLLALYNMEKSGITPETLPALAAKVEASGFDTVAAGCEVGVPTLRDIVTEITKPGRDIREELSQPILRTDILGIKDLAVGMVLSGTVRNVIDFGVFVDIGVHQDGLVHISEIANRYIKHPSEVLKVGDAVKVKVIGIDNAKNRIGLSIKQLTQAEKE